ncbi:MAG: membrane protein insertion efficiency factor YidD [Helicobacteraceae bacterium]|nr:membrane protein insertion efficiency factor YidD [Helicobacteraceae bacterium]
MIKKSLLKLLWLYQRFFTLIGFGSCRYYPTCSEYAKWQFEQNSIFYALYHSFLRILRCNQLFDGGVEYPYLQHFKQKPSQLSINSIKYWLVPKEEQSFFIIKNFTYEGQ